MKTLSVAYRSQLDNHHNPYGSCNVTSVAMCLGFFGVKSQDPNEQLEDELYRYMRDNSLSRHSPHDLAIVVRKYGCVNRFTFDATIDQVKSAIDSGNPCILHGYFTRFGHIVVAVGYNSAGLLIHDPYGEYFEDGYRTDISGAWQRYSYDLIRRVCIPDGQFWVHFVSK